MDRPVGGRVHRERRHLVIGRDRRRDLVEQGVEAVLVPTRPLELRQLAEQLNQQLGVIGGQIARAIVS